MSLHIRIPACARKNEHMPHCHSSLALSVEQVLYRDEKYALSIMCLSFLRVSTFIWEGGQGDARRCCLFQPLAPEGAEQKCHDILPASTEPCALSISLRSAALHVSHLCNLMMILIVSWECVPDGSGLRLPRASPRTTEMLTRCALYSYHHVR